MLGIKIRLSMDLKNAIKERNMFAVKAIRSIMSEIDNAGAVTVDAPQTMFISGGIAGATEGVGSAEVPRKELSDEDIKQIIKNEIDEMAKTAELIKDTPKSEASHLAEQINILRKYL